MRSARTKRGIGGADATQGKFLGHLKALTGPKRKEGGLHSKGGPERPRRRGLVWLMDGSPRGIEAPVGKPSSVLLNSGSRRCFDCAFDFQIHFIFAYSNKISDCHF